MRFLATIFALLFVSCVYSAPIDLSDPNQVLHSVSSNTFARLKAEKVHLQQDPAYINVVIKEELLPYFDYKYAAYKVMGPHLQHTSKEQRSEFVEAFRTYLVNVYGHILFEYKQQSIEILDNRNFNNKKIIAISVNVRDEHNQLTHLMFKLRKNSKTGQWKVFDVVAEGVSMLNTKQSEIGELIQKKGIAHVIDLLQQKNRE